MVFLTKKAVWLFWKLVLCLLVVTFLKGRMCGFCLVARDHICSPEHLRCVRARELTFKQHTSVWFPSCETNTLDCVLSNHCNVFWIKTTAEFTELCGNILLTIRQKVLFSLCVSVQVSLVSAQRGITRAVIFRVPRDNVLGVNSVSVRQTACLGSYKIVVWVLGIWHICLVLFHWKTSSTSLAKTCVNGHENL